MPVEDIMPEAYSKDVLVLGCGNILLGDDGFGPAVADYLAEERDIPINAMVLNAGTSVRKILFNVVLSEARPKMVVIIDAVDCGRKPGELFEIDPEDIPEKKIDDFSMHQMPTSNLLKELKGLGKVEVRIIVCQPANIPDTVQPGLSKPVSDAVPGAADMVMAIIGKV